MALSDAAIRSAKPAAKQFKLYDEGGLFLIVRPGFQISLIAAP